MQLLSLVGDQDALKNFLVMADAVGPECADPPIDGYESPLESSVFPRARCVNNTVHFEKYCVVRLAREGKRSILEGFRSHLSADRRTRDQPRPP